MLLGESFTSFIQVIGASLSRFRKFTFWRNNRRYLLRLSEITKHLRQIGIIPIILGGSQDLTVALYRSFEQSNHWVNIVSVDNRFDFSQEKN